MTKNNKGGSDRALKWRLPRPLLLPLLLSGAMIHGLAPEDLLAAPPEGTLGRAMTPGVPRFRAPSAEPQLRLPQARPVTGATELAAILPPHPPPTTAEGELSPAPPSIHVGMVPAAEVTGDDAEQDHLPMPAMLRRPEPPSLGVPPARPGSIVLLPAAEPPASPVEAVPNACDRAPEENATDAATRLSLLPDEGGARICRRTTGGSWAISAAESPASIGAAASWAAAEASIDPHGDANQLIPDRRALIATLGRSVVQATVVGAELAVPPARPTPPPEIALPVVPVRAIPRMSAGSWTGRGTAMFEADANHAIPARQESAMTGLYPGSSASRRLALAQIESRRTVTAEWGDTYIDLLSRAGVQEPELSTLAAALATELGSEPLRSGQQALLSFAGPGWQEGRTLTRFELALDRQNVLRAQRQGDGSFSAGQHERDVHRQVVGVAGPIQDLSLIHI